MHLPKSWLTILGITIGAMLLLEGVAVFGPWRGAPAGWLLLLGNFLGLLFCLLAIVRALHSLPTARERFSWLCIGAGSVFALIGDAIAFYQFQHHHFYNTTADLFYLGSFLPLWIGIFLQPELQAYDRTSRITLMLEMLLGMLAVGPLLWFFFIGPIISGAPESSLSGQVLLLAYPLMDAATIVGVLVLILHTRRSAFLTSRLLLVSALTVLTIGDSLFSFLVSHGAGQKSDLISALWPLANLLFGLAGLAQARVYSHSERLKDDSVTQPSRRRLVLPLFLVLVQVGLVLWHGARLPMSLGFRGLLIGAFAVFAVLIVYQWLMIAENYRLYSQLNDTYREMARQARTDPITRLPNYRAFMEQLSLEMHRANRYHTPLALIYADLDEFKQVNDTFGHPQGDYVLGQVAQAMQRCVRATDLLARYAGEEFVVVLPQTTQEQARILAERLRAGVEHLRVPMPNGDSLGVTLSLGISAYPEPAENIEALITHADEAMYCAKQQGRNRVSLHGESPLTPVAPK